MVMLSVAAGGSTTAPVSLYRVRTLFFQPGVTCSQPMHGEFSDVVQCSVESAKGCSVSRHWTVLSEESSKQPLCDCIGHIGHIILTTRFIPVRSPHSLARNTVYSTVAAKTYTVVEGMWSCE